jgi:hypothetical protein
VVSSFFDDIGHVRVQEEKPASSGKRKLETQFLQRYNSGKNTPAMRWTRNLPDMMILAVLADEEGTALLQL